MSLFSARKMFIPMWTGTVLGLFVLFGPPLTLAGGLLLALVTVAPPTILVILSKAPPLTLSEAIAEELHPVDRSRER